MFSVVMVLILAPSVVAQPLPEGDNGIAAQYPNDVGIGNDSAVVFHEDFEAIPGGSLTYDNSNFDAAYGENVITQQPENVHGGVKAVERTHASPGSFGAVKHLSAGYETLFLRYYMKYHPQFPGCHHTGGGIYAAAGPDYTQIGDITGVRPDGTNHFQAWLDDMAPFFNWSPAGNDTPPGWLHFYCYNMDQGSQYGDLLYPDGLIIPGASGVDFGADFVPRPNFNPERGRWYSFEVMVKANTPGVRDGRIAFWVDGQLAGDFPNLNLRSADSLKLNHVAISTYSSEVHPNKTLWYDDVVAATSYIGPMVPGGPVDAGDGGANGDDGGTQGDDGGVPGDDEDRPVDHGSVPGDDGGANDEDGEVSGCGCGVNRGSGVVLFGLLAFLPGLRRRKEKAEKISFI